MVLIPDSPVLNIIARYIFLLLCMVCVTGSLCAQSTEEEQDNALIERTKSLLVSTLDGSLPKIRLDYFLNYESGGNEIRWEVNDCGEQTGNPENNQEIPTCVEADFDSDRRTVVVMIAIGSTRQARSKSPTLFNASITDPNGQIHSLRHLGDLPRELHRPFPKPRRDVPPPTRAGVNVRPRITAAATPG